MLQALQNPSCFNHPWTKEFYIISPWSYQRCNLYLIKKTWLIQSQFVCVILCVSGFNDFRDAKEKSPHRPLCFSWAQKYLKTGPQNTRFFKTAHSVPQYSLKHMHTFSYIATVWKPHVSGPGFLVLGSEGRWCQRSTDSLWSFFVSRMEGDLQVEIQHVGDQSLQGWISTSTLCPKRLGSMLDRVVLQHLKFLNLLLLSISRAYPAWEVIHA